MIALPDFEQNVRAALSRVLLGESLVLVDGSQHIAQITPPVAEGEGTAEPALLVDFFMQSPLRDSGLVISREAGDERPAVEF